MYRSKNLIMVDFAYQDRRSVSAMLRGYGDGREFWQLNLQLVEQLLKEWLEDQQQKTEGAEHEVTTNH